MFDHIDGLSAPRLVEYWEQDPCAVRMRKNIEVQEERSDGRLAARAAPRDEGAKLGVKIEAEFAVGEYQIVASSRRKTRVASTPGYARSHYAIPEAQQARSHLRHLKPDEVLRRKSRHHESEEERTGARCSSRRCASSSSRTLTCVCPCSSDSSTPARKQDLIVYVLVAVDKRYEVANYPNITIPTNLDVVDAMRKTSPLSTRSSSTPHSSRRVREKRSSPSTRGRRPRAGCRARCRRIAKSKFSAATSATASSMVASRCRSDGPSYEERLGLGAPDTCTRATTRPRSPTTSCSSEARRSSADARNGNGTSADAGASARRAT